MSVVGACDEPAGRAAFISRSSNLPDWAWVRFVPAVTGATVGRSTASQAKLGKVDGEKTRVEFVKEKMLSQAHRVARWSWTREHARTPGAAPWYFGTLMLQINLVLLPPTSSCFSSFNHPHQLCVALHSRSLGGVVWPGGFYNPQPCSSLPSTLSIQHLSLSFHCFNRPGSVPLISQLPPTSIRRHGIEYLSGFHCAQSS
jgi:hypothetical protein